MSPYSNHRPQTGPYWTPPPTSTSRITNHATSLPMSEKPFHILHKVPSGDSPYVRAKHTQLVSKDPSRAVSLFWAAINAGDRVDSALKDMAVIMKQLDRSDEGIEAIKSFRYLCPFESQESIDNLLLELYKKSGRVEEEAGLLEHKLKMLEQEMGSGCRVVRAKRVQGKHVTMTVEQEVARILGNLGWVHLQLHNYGIAEQHYRRALRMEPDKNKMCNLAVCLMRIGKIQEAKSLLKDVRDSSADIECGDEPFAKAYDRAVEMLGEIESKKPESGLSEKFYAGCSFANGMKENKAPGINYSNVRYSPASVRQNTAGLFTQPRGRKWDERKETSFASRKLTFGAERVNILRRGEEPTKRKILDHNMIHGLHEYISEPADCMNSGKKSWADIADEEDEEDKQLEAESKTAEV